MTCKPLSKVNFSKSTLNSGVVSLVSFCLHADIAIKTNRLRNKDLIGFIMYFD
jgi:hypothetical protein